MVDFVFEEDVAEEAEQGGGSFGTLDTGVYDVTIKHASLDKTKGGNNTLSLSIETKDGHQTTLWNVFGTIDKVWKSGSENFSYKNFQAFMAAAGAKSITPFEYKLEIEGREPKYLSCVKELHGKKMKLAIQKVLDVYNSEVKESNEIHSSYNEKGQTYLEAKTGEQASKITKVAERLKDKETKQYKAYNGSPVEIEEEDEPSSSLL